MLLLHVNSVEWEPVKPAIKVRDPPKSGREEDALLILVSVEKGDDDEKIGKAVEEIVEHANRIKVDKIVLYPYAHLSDNLAPPSEAIKVMNNLAERLSSKFEVKRAPFGWYKRFKVDVKGHPLAELSKRF